MCLLNIRRYRINRLIYSESSIEAFLSVCFTIEIIFFVSCYSILYQTQLMKLTQYPVYLILVILYCVSSCGPSLDDEVAEAYEKLPDRIDFNFHVRPILSDRCFHCHGPDENTRMADLRLDTEEGMFSHIPGKEQFPVVSGSPSKSVLIDRILSDNPETVMPTPESNLKLSPAEKATLIKWVEQGAEFKDHWAYSPPQKAPLPKVSKTDWPLNPIDYFVLSKLEQNGMQPSPRASKETLIRRLTFDLNGLPPSLTEIEDFINDTSPQAYEKLVDRLLASSRYGERWAWEWLDVARYSDTNGFQGDFERDMWPWRDWVIKLLTTTCHMMNLLLSSWQVICYQMQRKTIFSLPASIVTILITRKAAQFLKKHELRMFLTA